MTIKIRREVINTETKTKTHELQTTKWGNQTNMVTDSYTTKKKKYIYILQKLQDPGTMGSHIHSSLYTV